LEALLEQLAFELLGDRVESHVSVRLHLWLLASKVLGRTWTGIASSGSTVAAISLTCKTKEQKRDGWLTFSAFLFPDLSRPKKGLFEPA
jgi:hypothetical protein